MQHYLFKTLLKLCKIKNSDGTSKKVFLAGPTGSGKTTMARNVAKELGINFFYTGAVIMPSDLVGSTDPHTGEWRQKAFTRAFINGGVFLADEQDAWHPNAMLAINAPLANGIMTAPDGTVHKEHPDFLFIGAANTWGSGPTAEYVGRNKLDAAYLDRFAYKLHVEYDSRLEKFAAGGDDVAETVCELSMAIRTNADKNGIKVIVSPRSSIDMADMVRAGISLQEAVRHRVLSGLDHSQIGRLLDGTQELFLDSGELPFFMG